MASHETVEMAEYFRLFAELECDELPLYRRLNLAAADDDELLALLTVTPRGQRRPNLILAAVHYLLLGGADDPLARWYPTVNGGAPPPADDPYPAFRRFVFERLDELTPLLETRSTQTNEVNRSCLWYAAWRAAAADLPDTPLAVVEVGASAGLNLAADRYRYDFGDGVIRGDPASEVGLGCEIAGGQPPIDAPLPPIVARRGIDLAPINLDDRDALRWLRACVWPEQLDRHARLDAALAQATRDPVPIVAGDAVDELADVVESCPPAAHVIVMNSWALTYLRRSRRVSFVNILDTLGATRPLTWISAEHPDCVDTFVDPDPDLDTMSRTLVGMARWRMGRRDACTVATVHPHLRWMTWHG